MKLGFMTNMKSLTEISDWALENGFEDMEVGPLVPLDEGEFGRTLDKGISITALAYCRNYLSTDEEEAALHLAELKKRILFASGMGIEKVVTSTGIDKSVEEGVYDRADAIRKIPVRSFDAFCRVFEPIVELAEEKNCPYLDVAEAVTGEDGCLLPELTSDGVHLNTKGCAVWREYLMNHPVTKTL